jgi:hypothetical protein
MSTAPSSKPEFEDLQTDVPRHAANEGEQELSQLAWELVPAQFERMKAVRLAEATAPTGDMPCRI